MSGVKSRATSAVEHRHGARMLSSILTSGLGSGALAFRRPADPWPWILLAIVAGTTIALVPDVVAGRISLNYQGDQGARIYGSAQDVSAGISVALGTFAKNLLGFHPPGDFLLRGLAWKLWSSIFGTGLNPIAFNLLLGLALGVATVWLLSLVAYRAAGWQAGLGTALALTASFVVNDTRLSAMGESTFMPWVAASFYFLANALDRNARDVWRPIVLAGVCALVSGLFRPEFMFLFPGCCLALWLLVGFWPATAFGAIGAVYPALKIVLPMLGVTIGLTMLNAGSLYFAPVRAWTDLPAVPFFLQFMADPTAAIVLVGTLLTICYLIAGARERTLAWKIVLLLSFTSLTYIAIISFAIVKQLATHNSYRLATPIIHLLIPAYVISAVQMYRQVGAGLKPESRGDWRIAGSIAGALMCVLLLGKFWYVDRYAMRARDDVGVTAAMRFVLARLAPSEAVYLDRARYWENLAIAFFSTHPNRPCSYSSCDQANAASYVAWGAQRNDNPAAGTIMWGEFSALRSHIFIRDTKPKFIVLANEPLLESWRKVAKRTWKDDWVTWHSHVYPYLVTPIDFQKPQPETFLKLGTVRSKTYFESYVKLVPRWRNKNFIVFEAQYGVSPQPS